MATAPKRGSNENNKIVRGSSNLGANMFEPHHAYPHVHSRNKLGAPPHGTSPSPRPHSHSGHRPLGPRSLTKSAKAPPNRQGKMKPNEIHGGWVPSLESVFSPSISIPWLFREQDITRCDKEKLKGSLITKTGNHCQDAVRWFQSVPCDRSPEHVPWKGKRQTILGTGGCHHHHTFDQIKT